MPKQQAKRRRKKYQAGSAYAGDVKPTGVLGFMSSGAMIKLIFVGMALALAIGGAAAIWGGDVFQSSPTSDNFVQPGDDNEEPTAPLESDFEPKSYASAPEVTIDPNASYTATIHTANGDIVVELEPGQALEAVNNFVFLAQDGFYNGLTFHYVEPGFEAIAGDPACSVDAPANLCRGDGGPGYELEQDTSGDFTTGTFGMANASQFFIALTDSDQFDEFPALGRVTSGLDVAEQLTANTPIESVDILVQ